MEKNQEHRPHDDMGTGEIHHIGLTKEELARLIKRCPYNRLSSQNAAGLQAKTWVQLTVLNAPYGTFQEWNNLPPG